MDIISRKQAKELGLSRYFTGKPCKHGHLCERVVDGECIECKRPPNPLSLLGMAIMSSPSTVRVAGPSDHDECWRLLMEGHAENSLFPLAEDKVKWFVNRAIWPEAIASWDTGTRGIIAVIGPVGALEALLFMTIGEFWYSHAKHIEEMLVFVDSRYRRSEHAKALVRWMKDQSEKTGLPLISGILSTTRTEAKCRLYQRLMPKIGEFFMVTPESPIMAQAVSMVSS